MVSAAAAISYSSAGAVSSRWTNMIFISALVFEKSFSAVPISAAAIALPSGFSAASFSAISFRAISRTVASRFSLNPFPFSGRPLSFSAPFFASSLPIPAS